MAYEFFGFLLKQLLIDDVRKPRMWLWYDCTIFISFYALLLMRACGWIFLEVPFSGFNIHTPLPRSRQGSDHIFLYADPLAEALFPFL